MLRRLRAPLAAVLVALAACGGQPVWPKVASAAFGTGFAAAAAGVNRAATGECWAACRPGMVCDRASGLCVEQGSRTGASCTASPAPAGEQCPEEHEYVVPAVDELRDAGTDGAR